MANVKCSSRNNGLPCPEDATHLNSLAQYYCAGCYLLSERTISLLNDLRERINRETPSAKAPLISAPMADTGKGYVGTKLDVAEKINAHA
jgi:hypothetical protein